MNPTSSAEHDAALKKKLSQFQVGLKIVGMDSAERRLHDNLRNFLLRFWKSCSLPDAGDGQPFFGWLLVWADIHVAPKNKRKA